MIDFPNISPVIVSFGPMAISWYSLSYVCGILIGWYYMIKLIHINNMTITKTHISDFVSWAIIGIIIGGRLGYVLIYDPVKYFSNPILILKTYEGGMSFHGGIIGYILASIIFSRINKINTMSLLDLSAASAPIGIFLGRIANFINAELYGRKTDLPWGVIFPGTNSPRHPSQIYEAMLEGGLLFIILFVLATKYKALSRKGFISGLFLIFYSVFRIFVEFFREPDSQIGFVIEGVTMGQILCIPMLLIGLSFILKSGKT